MALPPYATLDELFDVYEKRTNRDAKNRERVKKFYHDDESFDVLMSRLIQKDYIRFQKFIKGLTDEEVSERANKSFPTAWKFFFVIMDIVQNDGEYIEAFDTLTRTYPSRNMVYMGWTFSIVQGVGTLISIFNRQNELVYRF